MLYMQQQEHMLANVFLMLSLLIIYDSTSNYMAFLDNSETGEGSGVPLYIDVKNPNKIKL